MSEIIPDKKPKLKLGGGWKVAIVFFTVYLVVRATPPGWNNLDKVLAVFTGFGWLVWIFS